MKPLLKLHQVTHFYGRVAALRDVTLELPGGPIGLIGQNGAGKSTLMQILLGLIRPTHGFAEVLGLPVRSSGLALRARIGYMPERDAILPGLNGIEFVALAGELCGMPRRHAMRRGHEVLSYLGLEDARYRRLEQYSVGMTQRLKLAATLVHDPDLLLLDEPTAGLDPDGRAAMLAVLRQLAARPGKSLLLASHLLGDIERICDTAVILNQGRVVRTGTLASLRTLHPARYRLKYEGEAGAFWDSLQRLGVAVQLGDRPGHALAETPAGWATRQFFAEAQQHAVVLTGLEPDEEDLSAAYQRVVEPDAGPERKVSASR